MERSGLSGLHSIVQHEEIGLEDEEYNEKEPLLKCVTKYGSQTTPAREEFERRRDIREWEIDDHKVPLTNLLSLYSTDLNRGLSDKQVFVNRERYGENVLTQPPKPSKLWKFFSSVFGGLNSLLWGCAFLSFLSDGAQYLYTDDISHENLILGSALIIVVHVSGAFSFYQEFKSDKIMESFKNFVPKFATVLRCGTRKDITVSELVVGDIVEVKSGDMIPADLRLFYCSAFVTDNSSLTGESEPQKRGTEYTSDNPMETKNLAFFSTSAVQGNAKGIVVRVGGKTLIGRLANLTSIFDPSPSPIALEMNRFIMIMTIRSLLFGGIFFTIALFMNFSLIDSIFFLIGIVVANVPEGLAVTFTTILSVTAKRMARNGCLVKNLQSVETLGSTSVICSDKTGTLTQNVMVAANLYFNDTLVGADMGDREMVGNVKFDSENDNGFKALANVARLCSRAVFKPDQDNVPIQKRLVEGDASETAILRFMELELGSVKKYKETFPKVCEIPFNSNNKFQVSIHSMQNREDGRHLLVMQGAPEKIMSLCKTILVKDKEFEIDSDWTERFNQVYLSLGRQGERVLGFCDYRLPLNEYPLGFKFDAENPDFLHLGLRFVGLISLTDPPRPSVPDAVSKCRSAGIKVVMVTGDHPVTATAIARAVGIISEGNDTIEEKAEKVGCLVSDLDPRTIKAAVVSGPELNLLTAKELENVLLNHTEIVFARTSPEQKYVIVDAFQSLGHIVAATGDGVNDSPALKKADIGISMGITGSEVSKESADLILLDDNFSSIVSGVEEGRLIFDNLKKLIAYNMADNIAEMYSVWVFMLLKIPLPMGTIAMLLSVLGTDVFPAISIAYEKAESDIMKWKPRNSKKQNLVTRQLLSYTYGQTAVIECTAGFFSYFVTYASYGFYPLKILGIRRQWESRCVNDLEDSFGQEWTYNNRYTLELMAQSAFFVAIVVTQIANVICCKTRRLSLCQTGMRNHKMNFAIFLSLLLATFLVYCPGLNSAVYLTPLRPELWIAPLPFALLLLCYDELRKFTIRKAGTSGWVSNEFDT